MRRWQLIVAVLAVGVVVPARAQPATIVSPKPDRTALTVYRAPAGEDSFDLRYLQGFAMVTERRRIRLPRGRSVIRFEGVAEGIVPVSAIIAGLPGGTIEKNRDARLLSPASLVDGSLGRQVTLTRINRATGRQVSEPATIIAGPRRGVILRTAAGIEALRCSGLSEHIAYDGVPADLSSKPVLSVVTTSPTAKTVTVRLTYVTSGFDWRASYVATLGKDSRTIDLFAWLTLANGNPESFPQADVQAVAGRLNRVASAAIPAEAAGLRLSCYPLGTTTSDLRAKQFEPAQEIVVTAQRLAAPVITPTAPPAPPPPPPPEDLGDLKLYRVPHPTTVGARAQKQVTLLAQAAVPFERRYRQPVQPGQMFDLAPTSIVLILKNETQSGLGIPLPAGGTALYALRGGDRLLLGLGTMTDRTTGETIRLVAGTSRQVLLAQTRLADGETMLTVNNANPVPVAVDVPIGYAGQKIDAPREVVARIDGIATWSPVVPPGGRAELRYRY